jgi:hypothetical protein
MDSINCICGGKHKIYNKSLHNKTIKHTSFIQNLKENNLSLKGIEERIKNIELTLDEIKEKTISSN